MSPNACAVAEVLIAKGFDACWRFNRDGSLRFGRPGRRPPRQGRARPRRDELPMLLVPLKPSRLPLAKAPAASFFLISDDDALKIARAAPLEIEPHHVGDAAEVAVAGQGGLVGGRQSRPATVSPQPLQPAQRRYLRDRRPAQSRGEPTRRCRRRTSGGGELKCPGHVYGSSRT